MQKIQCATCGRTITNSEVRAGKAFKLKDRILCSSCFETKRQNDPVKCNKCGSAQPPLFDGKRHLCRKCGAPLKVRPAVPVRPDHVEPTAEPQPRPTGAAARIKPRSPLVDHLAGALITGALVALGILAYPAINPPVQPEQQEEPGQGIDRREVQRVVHRAVEAGITSHNEKLTDSTATLLAEVKDRIAALEQRIERLEIQPKAEGSEQAAAGATEPDDDIDAILGQIRQKKNSQETAAGADEETTQAPNQPEVPVIEEKAAAADELPEPV
jgi:uncharacterized small protein (DUF1192 family)